MFKKLKWSMLLVLVLALVLPLAALAAAPGDVVTAVYTAAPVAGRELAGLDVSYTASAGLEITGATIAGLNGSATTSKAFAFAFAPVPSATVTVTAKVKADATGTQTIKFHTASGSDLSGKPKYGLPDKTVEFAIEVPEVPEVWDKGVVTKEPTCTEAGVKTFTSDKGNTRTEAIPALGHDWGEWVVVKAATCTEAGSSKRVCKTDDTHVETRVDKALGHDWGEWVVVKAATCTAEGTSERICKNDKAHKETRVDPALPHKEGKWEIVKQPDAKNKENGLKVLRCAVGGEILKEEVIPYVTTTYFYKNTATTQGLRFRDVNPELTGKWYMFTPVDLSVDGVQEIPIIASNMYYIGNLTLTVAEGNVTAEYKMARGVNVRSEFLSYFADLSLVEKVEPAQIAYKKLPFGEPVSIEEELKGDTKVLLYTHFVVDYNDDLNIQRFFTSSKEYKALVSALKEMMD